MHFNLWVPNPTHEICTILAQTKIAVLKANGVIILPIKNSQLKFNAKSIKYFDLQCCSGHTKTSKQLDPDLEHWSYRDHKREKLYVKLIHRSHVLHTCYPPYNCSECFSFFPLLYTHEPTVPRFYLGLRATLSVFKYFRSTSSTSAAVFEERRFL